MIDRTFYAMIGEFALRHPLVRLHVHVSSQHVDLVRGGYDVAMRASSELEPGLVARTLQRARLIAVASPAYLEEKGIPKTARDLKNHRCVMGFARGEVPQTHWPLKGGAKLQVEGTFFSNEIMLQCEAALRGLGIAFMPLIMASSFLESGALVNVLSGIVEAEARIAIVYAEREFVPPHVRAFVDAVAEWARTELGKPIPIQCREGGKKARKRGAGT